MSNGFGAGLRGPQVRLKKHLYSDVLLIAPGCFSHLRFLFVTQGPPGLPGPHGPKVRPTLVMQMLPPSVDIKLVLLLL